MDLSGKSAVYCIHDREKRMVSTEEQIEKLGYEVGIVYDSRVHKIHTCVCCENMFIDPTDIPRYCSTCSGPLVHKQGGPLPEPRGVA
jgi:hypothetical protein